MSGHKLPDQRLDGLAHPVGGVVVRGARGCIFPLLRKFLRRREVLLQRCGQRRCVARRDELAGPAVVDLFLDEESQALAMLSDFIGKPVSLQSEPSYSPEQYDIVLM